MHPFSGWACQSFGVLYSQNTITSCCEEAGVSESLLCPSLGRGWYWDLRSSGSHHFLRVLIWRHHSSHLKPLTTVWKMRWQACDLWVSVSPLCILHPDVHVQCVSLWLSRGMLWLVEALSLILAFITQEKDRDGCPKIVSLGSSKADFFLKCKKYGFKKRWLMGCHFLSSSNCKKLQLPRQMPMTESRKEGTQSINWIAY